MQVVTQPIQSREGWVCPKCRAVHSPDVRSCHCNSHGFAPTTMPTTTWPVHPVDSKPRCPKCGIALNDIMAYVCGQIDCPTGLGTTARTSYGPSVLTE